MSSNCCQVPGVNTADNNCSAANSSCGCGNSGTSSPYYNQAGSIQETHCQSTTVQQYAAALSTGSAFVMPTCNHEAIINFPGLTRIQVGSYLWNATYGYLLITGFDPVSGDVTVMNECQAGNAAPGTTILRCTLFTVTGPP